MIYGCFQAHVLLINIYPTTVPDTDITLQFHIAKILFQQQQKGKTPLFQLRQQLFTLNSFLVSRSLTRQSFELTQLRGQRACSLKRKCQECLRYIQFWNLIHLILCHKSYKRSIEYFNFRQVGKHNQGQRTFVNIRMDGTAHFPQTTSNLTFR